MVRLDDGFLRLQVTQVFHRSLSNESNRFIGCTRSAHCKENLTLKRSELEIFFKSKGISGSYTSMIISQDLSTLLDPANASLGIISR